MLLQQRRGATLLHELTLSYRLQAHWARKKELYFGTIIFVMFGIAGHIEYTDTLILH